MRLNFEAEILLPSSKFELKFAKYFSEHWLLIFVQSHVSLRHNFATTKSLLTEWLCKVPAKKFLAHVDSQALNRFGEESFKTISFVFFFMLFFIFLCI